MEVSDTVDGSTLWPLLYDTAVSLFHTHRTQMSPYLHQKAHARIFRAAAELDCLLSTEHHSLISLWNAEKKLRMTFSGIHSWYYSGLSFVNESNSQWKVKRSRGPLLTGISLQLVDLDVQLGVWLRASSQGAAGHLTCCCWLRQLMGVFSQTWRSVQRSWGPLTTTCLSASGGVSRICFPNFLLHLCLHFLAISLYLSYVSSSATTPAKLSRSLCKF